jgi:hypothetical protein
MNITETPAAQQLYEPVLEMGWYAISELFLLPSFIPALVNIWLHYPSLPFFWRYILVSPLRRMPALPNFHFDHWCCSSSGRRKISLLNASVNCSFQHPPNVIPHSCLATSTYGTRHTVSRHTTAATWRLTASMVQMRQTAVSTFPAKTFHVIDGCAWVRCVCVSRYSTTGLRPIKTFLALLCWHRLTLSMRNIFQDVTSKTERYRSSELGMSADSCDSDHRILYCSISKVPNWRFPVWF